MVPTSLRLETSSACQLRCPSCPTTAGLTHRHLGTGLLRFADFKALLEDNPGLKRVELSNYGEAFLNPELTRMLAFACERGVSLSLNNGVNLNQASEEQLESLVKYRLTGLSCSIDGVTQESYALYRKRGNLATVLRHIESINGYKRLYGSALPHLRWQFIVFGHNEHEIPAAKELAARLDMSIVFKMNWDENFAPLQRPDWVMQETGWQVASRAEHLAQTHQEYKHQICRQLWHTPQINWDGRLLGCCRNFWGDFGANVFEVGLSAALASEKLAYARQMLSGQAAARPDIPCTSCSVYHNRQKYQDWMGPEGSLTK